MAPQPSEIQGNSNPAEPPPEVRLDMDSEGTTTDKASQGSGKPTEGINVDLSSKDLATDKASQDGGKTTRAQRKKTLTSKEYRKALIATVKPTRVVNENYRELFKATVIGDWKAIEIILNRDPEAMTATLLTSEDVHNDVLSIAITAGQDQLVENLIKRFPTQYKCFTLVAALYNAVRNGRIRKAKELVDELEKVCGEVGVRDALLVVTRSAPRQKEVIWYLAKRTTIAPTDDIVSNLIGAGHLDILLYLAHQFPGLAAPKDNRNIGLLEVFARVKSYYRSGAKLNFWETCIYRCIPRLVDTSFDNAKDTKMARAIHQFKISLWNLATKPAPLIKRIGELKLRHECSLKLANLSFNEKKACMETLQIHELISTIVLNAASSGIFEIVELCFKHSPELMWDQEFTKELIEEVVKGRHVELFRLLNAYNTFPKLRYEFQRNCDLMAAVLEWSPEYVPADVSGAAFLMQRELQWFEVLEDRSSPLMKSLKFKVKEDESSPSSKSLELQQTEERSGKTYWEIFVERRKDLLKEAGQWMKDTSSSCSLVATLIFTVAFAAAFTVPGSTNDSSTGVPIFLKKGSFLVFTVANALALLSSITATLMFLAILTSRYAAEDFLHSLPRKMILGLTFLFLSLVFMLVAFGSALTIVLSEQWKWIYIPITLLAAYPVILFAMLQLPLYVEMVESTFCPRLYHPVKIWK